jgi:hypothetical protein
LVLIRISLKFTALSIKNRIATMENESETRKKRNVNRGASGGIYGLAFIGALIYFIQHATTFWIGVLGFFKAVLWPAFLVYKLMEFLQM